MEDLTEVIKKAHNFLQFRNVFCILPHMVERTIQIYLKMDNARKIRKIKKMGKQHGARVLYQNLKTFDNYCQHMQQGNHSNLGLCKTYSKAREVMGLRLALEGYLYTPGVNLYSNVQFYNSSKERQEFKLITIIDSVIIYNNKAALLVIQKEEEHERRKQKEKLNRFAEFTERVYKVLSFPFRVVPDFKEKSFELLDSRDNVCTIFDIENKLEIK